MKRGVPQKRANVGCTTTPCTNLKKSYRRKLEKKTLRVMIGSLQKVKGKSEERRSLKAKAQKIEI